MNEPLGVKSKQDVNKQQVMTCIAHIHHWHQETKLDTILKENSTSTLIFQKDFLDDDAMGDTHAAAAAFNKTGSKLTTMDEQRESLHVFSKFTLLQLLHHH